MKINTPEVVAVGGRNPAGYSLNQKFMQFYLTLVSCVSNQGLRVTTLILSEDFNGKSSAARGFGMFLINYAYLALGLLITGTFFGLGLKLLRINRAEGKKSAMRAPSVRDAVMGRSRMTEDWIPDGRVKGGMVYNRKKKRIEISGRLSADSLDRVFPTSSY